LNAGDILEIEIQNTKKDKMMISLKSRFVTTLLFTIYSIILFIEMIPNLPIYNHVSHGLDPSWVLGLNWAIIKNLQFGKDILFTYGPLGFIQCPLIFNYDLWRLSIFVYLVITGFFIFSIVFLLKSLKVKWYIWVLLFAIFWVLSIPLDYLCIISAIIWSYITINSDINNKLKIFYFFICLSLFILASLIKVSSLFISIFTIFAIWFVFCIFYEYNINRPNRNWSIKRKDIQSIISLKFLILLVLMLSSFLIFFSFFFYFFSGQNILNFYPFIKGSIDLAFVYNSAMSINGNSYEFVMTILIVILFLISIIFSYLSQFYKTISFFIISVVFLFFSFKHGIVRHDGHIFLFLNAWLLMVFLILSINLSERRKLCNLHKNFTYLLGIILCLLFISNAGIIHIYNQNSIPSFVQKENAVTEKLSYTYKLNDIDFFSNTLSSTKQNIQSHTSISPTNLFLIKNQTIDIIPWDISTLWAYDLNWTPRPVMQSYSAYSQYLDSLDTKYYTSNTSPKYILFKYTSIDNRYPLFDEPSAFSTIIENYKYLNSDNNFLLLEKQINKNPQNLIFVNSSYVNYGDWVDIPKIDNPVYAKIKINYSLLGKIMNLFFKPSQVNIQFYLDDRNCSTEKQRVIPELLNDGCYISNYIENQDDLELLIKDQLNFNIISKLKIIPDNYSHYLNNYLIEFYVKESSNAYKDTNQFDDVKLENPILDTNLLKLFDKSNFLEYSSAINNTLQSNMNYPDYLLEDTSIYNSENKPFLHISGWIFSNITEQNMFIGLKDPLNVNNTSLIFPTNKETLNWKDIPQKNAPDINTVDYFSVNISTLNLSNRSYQLYLLINNTSSITIHKTNYYFKNNHIFQPIHGMSTIKQKIDLELPSSDIQLGIDSIDRKNSSVPYYTINGWAFSNNISAENMTTSLILEGNNHRLIWTTQPQDRQDVINYFNSLQQIDHNKINNPNIGFSCKIPINDIPIDVYRLGIILCDNFSNYYKYSDKMLSLV
jgi:hypothetical protein